MSEADEIWVALKRLGTRIRTGELNKSNVCLSRADALRIERALILLAQVVDDHPDYRANPFLQGEAKRLSDYICGRGTSAGRKL